MNIVIVDERPTQFFAPFFRYASGNSGNHLRVIFTRASDNTGVFDPELGQKVTWGFDLFSGYEHTTAPQGGTLSWWRAELARTPCDLVILNGYTRRPYVFAALAAKSLGIPVALRTDSVLFTDTPARRVVKQLLFSAALKNVFQVFFATGSLTRQYLQSYGVPQERIRFFTYAVDHDAFRLRSRVTAEERAEIRGGYGLPGGVPIILCVAKLNSREAPWDVLRALAATPAPRAALAIAGAGPEQGALERFAAEQNLSGVRFLGYVPYGDLPRLYAACDLFIHAAREERWGVSVAEAMACGLPVIASSGVGAGYDLILPGRNGERYDAGDSPALAACLPGILALDRTRVDQVNQEVLTSWGYDATWRGLVDCAQQLASRAQKKN